MNRPITDDRPVGTLVTDLFQKTATLVRKEVQLGKAEINQKVSQVSSGIGALAVGGAIAFAGLLVLLDAAVMALAQALAPQELHPWVSPLIVGGVVAIIGLILLAKGKRNLKPENLTPSRTMESVRRDKEFVKEQTHDTA